ncbi:MAG: RNA polymerase sigma factor [Bacteroidales bacterium]|nr:RNA polymerase sigma factor [Bacteroidales bacterium]
MSERQIIENIRKGAYEQAFSEIAQAYSERLYWHVRRYTCSHEDADDLVQDIFMKVWNALPSFQCNSSVYTWLYRIATNEALNYIRKNKFKAMLQAQTLETILNNKIDEDPYFNGDDMQRELHKAINALPVKQKTVFLMRYFDELPYEDISEITGTSVGALKASYHFAYNKIKEKLQKIF